MMETTWRIEMEKPGDWLRTYFKLGDTIDLYALEQLRAEADRLDGVGMTEEVIQVAMEKWPGMQLHLALPKYTLRINKPVGAVGDYTACIEVFSSDAPTIAALLEKIRGAK